MKKAKRVDQAGMLTPQISSRIMIQMNGPIHPDALSTTTPEERRACMVAYNSEVTDLIKRSIQRWGVRNHTSSHSVSQSLNGQQARGVPKANGGAASAGGATPGALEIIAGTACRCSERLGVLQRLGAAVREERWGCEEQEACGGEKGRERKGEKTKEIDIIKSN